MTELLTTIEAARLLRVQPSTLQNWRSSRCGPAYVEIGRRIFYRLQDLDVYLESRRVEPANGHRSRNEMLVQTKSAT